LSEVADYVNKVRRKSFFNIMYFNLGKIVADLFERICRCFFLLFSWVLLALVWFSSTSVFIPTLPYTVTLNLIYHFLPAQNTQSYHAFHITRPVTRDTLSKTNLVVMIEDPVISANFTELFKQL